MTELKPCPVCRKVPKHLCLSIEPTNPAKYAHVACPSCGFGIEYKNGYAKGDEQQEKARAEWNADVAIETVHSCPCHYTEPCSPRCSCVVPTSSAGCERCCAYGSAEQKAEKAQRIAAALEKTPEPGIPGSGAQRGES